jgi:hypothetical protein
MTDTESIKHYQCVKYEIGDFIDHSVIRRGRQLGIFGCNNHFNGFFTDFLKNFIQAAGVETGHVGFVGVSSTPFGNN